jgi:hypothetical protein
MMHYNDRTGHWHYRCLLCGKNKDLYSSGYWRALAGWEKDTRQPLHHRLVWRLLLWLEKRLGWRLTFDAAPSEEEL